MRSTLVSVSLIALCSVPGLAATPKLGAPSPARRLPAPDDVPPHQRQALKARMGQHPTAMQNLVRAVVLLDRPTTQALAERIAGEQTFAQTFGPGPHSIPAIPRSVVFEGEAFVAAARELAFAAATGSNDAVLADRFAVLTRICVSCHSGYLHGLRMRNPIEIGPSDGEPLLEEQPKTESSQSPRSAPR